jgi:uncharacterized protein
MTMIRFLALALAALLCCGGTVCAQEVDPGKQAEIEKLLQTTGAMRLGQQFSAVMVAQLTHILRSTHANVPQKALDVLPEEVNGVIADHMPQLRQLMVRIYDRHFSVEELKGLNQFYATELGRKVIATLPLVLRESMAAGQQWGQALGPEIERRVKARFEKEKITL